MIEIYADCDNSSRPLRMILSIISMLRPCVSVAEVIASQSQAIKTPSAIYCSGQIPLDAEGNFVQGTIQEKTGACIKNLKAVLTAAGSGIEKVVKVNIFLADMDSFAVRSKF